MKAQTKTQKSTLKNWQEADNCLKLLGIIEQKLKALESEMNLKLTEIQDKYKPQIDSLKEDKIGLERNLELFCQENRNEFDEKKSKELSFGIVSFRLSPPSLKQLKGFTWESIKLLIQKSKKYANSFLKTKIDINKQAILNSDLPESELAKFGLCIDQKENFYYEIFDRK